MKRRILGPISGVALLILLSAPTAIGYRKPPPSRPAAPPPAAPLADTYHLTLESAWPQLGGSGKGTECRNGGDEMIRGLVTRNQAGTYEGTLDRTTLLFFCGAHSGSGAPCELVLEGDGGVAVRGVVVPDADSPSGSALRLSWSPRADHAAKVEGACSPEFKRSVRQMYLSVRHGVELPLPAAGKALHQRLEGYGWTVDIE